MPLTTTTIKEYHATLLQVGDTNPPTKTELHNTLGTITWTRQQAGIYRANSNHLFTENKTAIILGTNDTWSIATWLSDSAIDLQTNDHGGTPSDGYLTNTAIEIKVYK